MNREGSEQYEQVESQLRYVPSKQHEQDTFTPQTYFLIFLLVVIGTINSTKVHDHNIAVALGLYFLSTIHHNLYKMYYFYLMGCLTVLADIIAIILLVGEVPTIYAIVLPVFQILIKIGIFVLQGIKWKKQQQKSGQQKELKKQKDENNNNFKQKNKEYQKNNTVKIQNMKREKNQRKHSSFDRNQKQLQYDRMRWIQNSSSSNQ